MIYDNEEHDVEQTDNDTKSIVYTFLALLVGILFIGVGIVYLVKTFA